MEGVQLAMEKGSGCHWQSCRGRRACRSAMGLAVRKGEAAVSNCGARRWRSGRRGASREGGNGCSSGAAHEEGRGRGVDFGLWRRVSGEDESVGPKAFHSSFDDD